MRSHPISAIFKAYLLLENGMLELTPAEFSRTLPLLAGIKQKVLPHTICQGRSLEARYCQRIGLDPGVLD